LEFLREGKNGNYTQDFTDQVILFQWTTGNVIFCLKLLRHFYRIFWFEEECRKKGQNGLFHK